MPLFALSAAFTVLPEVAQAATGASGASEFSSNVGIPELVSSVANLKGKFKTPGFLTRRGIVIAAGGVHLLSNAYVTAKVQAAADGQSSTSVVRSENSEAYFVAQVIRKHHKSKLPILTVYCGAEEYDMELATLLRASTNSAKTCVCFIRVQRTLTPAAVLAESW